MDMSFFRSLFGRRRSIRNVSIDELRRERIVLDNEERGLKKSVDRVQDEDRRLLEEYAAAQRARDAHQSRFVARKLQEIREQARVLDLRHGFLAKQMRTVSGLILIKENARFFAANSRLENMDLADLQMYVEEATTEGELTQDKLDTLLQTMDDAAGQSRLVGDRSLTDFMSTLDAEASRAGLDAESAVSTQDLNQALATVERELAVAGPQDAPREAGA